MSDWTKDRDEAARRMVKTAREAGNTYPGSFGGALEGAVAEIDRLTTELASHAKAATDWRDTAERHLARAEAVERDLTALRAATDGRLPTDVLVAMGRAQGVLAAIDADFGEIRWAADQLRPYGAEARVDFGGVGQAIRSLLAAVDTVASGAQVVASLGDTSIEARRGHYKALPPNDDPSGVDNRAATAFNAFAKAYEPDVIPPYMTLRAAWQAVVRAVDASRPALPEVDAEDLWTDFRTDAEIDARLLWASDRAAFLAGVAAGRRTADASRPGLTEEQARDEVRTVLGRFFAMTPTTIAAVNALVPILRASRGETGPAPIDYPGVRDALRALAHAMCATQARDPEQKAQLQRAAEAHDALRYALGDKDPSGETGPAPTWGEQAIAEHRRAAAPIVKAPPAALHAPREAPAPGHVSIPRRALEKLVDATQRDPDVREAREAAEHVLHQDFLRHEPARTDPDAARRLAKARAERDRLEAKVRSYDGGDRPQSPPASLIRELYAAKDHVRRLEAAK